ncbi:hypothetical protein JNM05_05425 [bacterium]|nr:hypothetical protein [bacterium]
MGINPAQLMKIVASAVLVGSCDVSPTDRAIWETLNIVDYHMNQNMMCFCVDAGVVYTFT